MFRRKKHKLPKFPADIGTIYRNLQQELSSEELNQLGLAVDEYLSKFQQLAGQHAHVNVSLAHALAERCKHLISLYPSMSSKHRGMVVAAIRYFVAHNDPLGDASFGSGLDDDAKVMNHTLEELGIEDRYLTVGT